MAYSATSHTFNTTDASKDNRQSFIRDQQTDVTIHIGDDSIRTHKQLLCSYSPYFEAMFSGLYTESQSDEIDLTNTIGSKAAFDELIVYMYTGELTVRDCILQELVEVTAVLLLEECKVHCCRYIKYNLNGSNSLRYWLIVYKYFEQYLPMCQNMLESCFHSLHIYEEGLFELCAEDVISLLRKRVHKYCTVDQIATCLLRWCNTYESVCDMRKIIREIDVLSLEKIVDFKENDTCICNRCIGLISIIREILCADRNECTAVNRECDDVENGVDKNNRGDNANEYKHKETCEYKGNTDKERDICVFESLRHVNLLKQITDAGTEIDVLLVAGPSYETLNHKFDLFSHNSELRKLKCDRVEFLDLSVYIPLHKKWLNVGYVPCPHDTLKLSVEFIDRNCSIHYCDENVYFRKGSKEALMYSLKTREFRQIQMKNLGIDGLSDSVKFVGSFVVGIDFYCFVTNYERDEFGDQEFYVIKYISSVNSWDKVFGPFSLFNAAHSGYVFDVVTLSADPTCVYVMFITKSLQTRSFFSGNVMKFDFHSDEPRKTNLQPLGEFLMEPFHWNISKQSNLLHLIHKASVMYTLDLNNADVKWRANENHVCLEGYLPSMKNSRCGQLACHSLFAASELGLWIVATRKIRGKYCVGCLSHMDLSRLPAGSVTEHPPPPYSIFTLMIATKMSVGMLRRFRDVRLYHRHSIWE